MFTLNTVSEYGPTSLTLSWLSSLETSIEVSVPHTPSILSPVIWNYINVAVYSVFYLNFCFLYTYWGAYIPGGRTDYHQIWGLKRGFEMQIFQKKIVISGECRALRNWKIVKWESLREWPGGCEKGVLMAARTPRYSIFRWAPPPPPGYISQISHNLLCVFTYKWAKFPSKYQHFPAKSASKIPIYFPPLVWKPAEN